MISATQKAQIRPVHPFPARMAPSIVLDVLPKAGKSLNILDPMSGSGTTLVCARSKGHHAIGCDTDPLALLISRTWCADVEPRNIKLRANLVLQRAKTLSNKMHYEDSYPKKADDETRRFIDFWFDAENRRQLAGLSICISRVQSKTERTLLWCAFSRMIITKTSGVSLAMDVSHSRPHKVFHFAPLKPFDAFLKAVSKVAYNCPFSANSNNIPPAVILHGDARALPVESASMDMVITSPPYLNAIDYLRGHKLSLVWMGHSISKIRTLRSDNIGTEVSMQLVSSEAMHETMKAMKYLRCLDERRQGMVCRYVLDMHKVIKECSRVLKTKGRAVFVVGNSAIRGVFIKNSEILARLAASNGLSLVSTNTRPIDTSRRYLPPPGSKKAGKEMQTRMKEEVILQFIKA